MSWRLPRSRHLGAAVPVCVAVFALTMAVGRSDVAGQGRAGGPQVPQTGRGLAPVDITGTWVSVVTEDWRWRMVTPPKGDVASIPVSTEGRKAALAWNLDADNASGNQCKAYGVGGIIRQPGRIRVSWQDDQTLKFEFDAGTQTRLLRFDRASQPPAERTLQGYSLAVWEGPGVGRGTAPTGDGRPDPRVTGGGLLARELPGGGGGGLRGGPPPRQMAQINRGGDLKVVTTNFREGYLRKNGVPYSERAVFTEYFNRLPKTDDLDLLLVTTIVEDPMYLSQAFYTSTHFKREADGSKFTPTPCVTAPPLPAKK